MKVFEAFAGIGTQRMALRNLGIEHEVVAIAEIDRYSIKSYESIHGKTHNVGDISTLLAEDIPDHDLFTYSFPCQDISVSGKQGGFSKNSGTRSSLLWECNRVIEEKKPKYLMLENVKNLVGNKFKPQFKEWLTHLESMGYTNYWQVLNAKDYGVPQNRERVFVISILGEHEPYIFPEKITLTHELENVLEKEVDEGYFLNKEKTATLLLNMNESKTVFNTDCKPIVIDDTQGFDGVRYYKKYSPTLRASRSGLKTMDKNHQIRKLTPKEYWRLMGCSDDDFHKAAEVNSKTQLYKQAGNAIVVDVLEQLFAQLFK